MSWSSPSKEQGNTYSQIIQGKGGMREKLRIGKAQDSSKSSKEGGCLGVQSQSGGW